MRRDSDDWNDAEEPDNGSTPRGQDTYPRARAAFSGTAAATAADLARRVNAANAASAELAADPTKGTGEDGAAAGEEMEPGVAWGQSQLGEESSMGKLDAYLPAA